MKVIWLLGLLFISGWTFNSGGDGIDGCTGTMNPFDLIDTEPQLVEEVENGRKYTYGIF